MREARGARGGGTGKLAGFLHSLGIVLNFRDDPRLTDTHVLKPDWVTSGIYTVLNSHKLKDQDGQISVSDLSGILDKQKYPPKMHRFLLDLMCKFDLCFAFGDDQPGRYLIPELLDKQEPAATSEFVPEQCLNFQYHYPVLPEGLIPRFIVRTHAMSTGLPRWRSGVILQFEGCQALVKGDVHERRVWISVTGPVRGQRNLLAIIRNDFERIHGDIKKLQPQAMVPVPNHPEVAVPYEKLLKFEEKGIPEFHEQVGDDILTLSVRELLNGVDVERLRKRQALLTQAEKAVMLFISYAHKDEALRAELDAHLKLLQRIGLVQKWHDRLLKPGEEWRKGIDENLERADIILLLVSADFLASDFCWQDEMERALERHQTGEARVIPVIIRKADWTQAKFAKLQALPKEGKAVTLWPDRDSAWTNVAEGIRRVAEEIRSKRSRAERAHGGQWRKSRRPGLRLGSFVTLPAAYPIQDLMRSSPHSIQWQRAYASRVNVRFRTSSAMCPARCAQSAQHPVQEPPADLQAQVTPVERVCLSCCGAHGGCVSGARCRCRRCSDRR